MKHSIPADQFGPLGESMAHAVQTCIHCGFCLPACPTFLTNGQEMDTPRGRIVLMKEVLEGTLPLSGALPHVDACLGCLACETACPSGVHYRDLISPFRAQAEPQRKRSFWEKIKRQALLQTLPYPGRFRVAATMGKWVLPLAKWMPKPLQPMFDLLPKSLPEPRPLRTHYKAQGTRRARVALMIGCVQQVLAPEINEATVSVLVRNGVEVIIPPNQGCCGALGWHIGEKGDAQDKAAANLAAFASVCEAGPIDAIISNAAGCGAGLKEYPLMLKGTRLETAAHAFADKVQDVSAFLAQLGLSAAIPPQRRPLTIAYQDACHLAHGQGVRQQPRHLLGAIPGVVIKDIAEAEICCGSAGSYNLDQPATAAQLGQRKVKNLLATEADYFVSGNIGCLTQLAAHFPTELAQTRLLHTIVALERAYAGTLG